MPSDNLTIDTPEQIALELPLAGIGSRMLACLLDSLIQVVAFVLVGMAISQLPPATFNFLPNWIAPMLFIFFWFGMYWGYYAAFEVLWQGQTPGKRWVGIRVVKDSGRPLNVYEAIGRNLMRAVDGFPGVYAVGIVVMALNAQNRRLGDFVAGSIVVYDQPTAELQPAWVTQPVDAATVASARLSADELVLVETYLQRRFELPDDVRRLRAWQIAEQLSRKLGVTIPGAQSHEDFIESLAGTARGTARLR